MPQENNQFGPSWFVDVAKMLAPVAIALVVFYVRFVQIESRVAGLDKWRECETKQVAELSVGQSEQQRRYDVLNAQVLAQLEGLRRDVSELRAERKKGP